MKPPVLILHAPGTNRDREAALAFELAGGAPEIVPLAWLADGTRRMQDYRMVVLPGGFSFGDDLGAGRLQAALLGGEDSELGAFIDSGRPVLGICNGFQTLVKTGLLPGSFASPSKGATAVAGPGAPATSLARNDRLRFECRWVELAPQPDSPCVMTRGLTEPIFCPVAHGEGRLVTRDAATRAALQPLVALRYQVPGGETSYPWNPNGSEDDIAGITNAAGNVLGLMPHPEDHVLPQQHPRAHRGERGGLGLALFSAAVRFAAEL